MGEFFDGILLFRRSICFIYKRGKLFGGTVPPNNTLFGGTVPPNSALFGGTPDFEKPNLISMKSYFGHFKGNFLAHLAMTFILLCRIFCIHLNPM